eukprot:CAMPEP_0170593556 /NCGR_PEP_ID=MMETSP0224-20130122/13515_1 /TAXON_ID=285029 /ORGANISM="Togula jolla, Strain CCCM 725" /LENGTH=214 /DNA_ID=CAMNT_0010917525 /DNA_START=72 /DNA_END=716 /DNA_ORIENTATION=+
MARRTRSMASPVVLAAALAVALVVTGWTFVASPQGLRGARQVGVLSSSMPSLVAAGGAMLVAGVPEPAHAGGMFDFGLTLPFVAITFLTMMAVLNALWYSPVTTEMDERNAKLLQTLSQATDNLAKADAIQVEYTEKIREARAKAAEAVVGFKKTTEDAIDARLAKSQAEREEKANEVKAKLQAEVQAKIDAAEPEIEKRKAEFVKETLASMGM